MIYLDNAATTPMDPEVLKVVQRSMRDDYANSGTVYSAGVDANRKIEQAREEIAFALSLPSRFRIVFTSGGSEANNLFIKGLCAPDRKAAYLGLEHPSVTEALDSLKVFGNDPVRLVEYREQGKMSRKAVPYLNEKRVRLLCLSHVNNELGVVQPIVEIAAMLRERSPQTRLFVDGVQAVGKCEFAETFWEGVSGYSVSAHKLNGPKGIGCLIYDDRLDLKPQIHGGKQQGGIRSGTLPTPLILGLARAIRISAERLPETRTHLEALNERLLSGLRRLQSDIPELKLRFNSLPVADWARQSPAICNFSFIPVEGEVVLHHLEKKGILVGLGSACSAHSKEPSRILRALGCSVKEALCSLRISFGPQNTLDEVDTFLREFGQAYQTLYPAFRSKAISK